MILLRSVLAFSVGWFLSISFCSGSVALVPICGLIINLFVGLYLFVRNKPYIIICLVLIYLVVKSLGQLCWNLLARPKQ